jgi:ABC-type transport system involved in cytochrome c biogenesis permease component
MHPQAAAPSRYTPASSTSSPVPQDASAAVTLLRKPIAVVAAASAFAGAYFGTSAQSIGVVAASAAASGLYFYTVASDLVYAGMLLDMALNPMLGPVVIYGVSAAGAAAAAYLQGDPVFYPAAIAAGTAFAAYRFFVYEANK